MFVRINSRDKIVNYINTSNILRMRAKNNQLDIYTVFRPKYSAHTIQFGSNQEAIIFAESCMRKPRFEKKVERLDQPSVDMLALQAMEDWEQEQKQLR